MASNALQQLKILQRTLYERAYKEAHSLVVGSSRSILSYSDKFEASLPPDAEKSTQNELLEAMRKRPFLLYGDFHTLKQSQRGLLRLLRSYIQKTKSANLVLAVEMFKGKHQPILDAYIRGEINDEELLDKTNYARDWGFPWPNFKMIIDFATQNAIPVIGINSDGGGRDTLAQRDKYAANLLLDAAEKYPDHVVVCLIGEYHLADTHLPRSLQRELAHRGKSPTNAIVRVVANVDRYYFKMHNDSIISTTEFLKLKRDFFCIINSPPWMKWQSYAIWEEMRTAGETQVNGVTRAFDEDAFDTYTEDTFDIDYQFLGLTKHLASFLGLRERKVDLNEFHIRYAIDGDFGRDVIKVKDIRERDFDGMLERAAVDGVYFTCQNRTILLTSLSINNLAEASGQFLHSALTGFNDFGDTDAETFYRKIIKSTVGMISSKILNPKRKARTIINHKRYVAKVARRRLQGHAATTREVAKAVLRHHEWMSEIIRESSGKFIYAPRAIYALDKQTHWEVSQAIGYIIGQTLYSKVMSNRVSTEKIRRLFLTRLPDFKAVWNLVADLYDLVAD